VLPSRTSTPHSPVSSTRAPLAESHLLFRVDWRAMKPGPRLPSPYLLPIHPCCLAFLLCPKPRALTFALPRALPLPLLQVTHEKEFQLAVADGARRVANRSATRIQAGIRGLSPLTPTLWLALCSPPLPGEGVMPASSSTLRSLRLMTWMSIGTE
jgi:hypothetical protein